MLVEIDEKEISKHSISKAKIKKRKTVSLVGAVVPYKDRLMNDHNYLSGRTNHKFIVDNL